MISLAIHGCVCCYFKGGRGCSNQCRFDNNVLGCRAVLKRQERGGGGGGGMAWAVSAESHTQCSSSFLAHQWQT